MMNPDFPKIIHVAASPTYRLLLTFDNGETRVFTMDKLADKFGLKPVFLQAYVEDGEVHWPGSNLDIAPDGLYHGSELV